MEYQELIRDGLPPHFTGQPPAFTRPQPANKDTRQHEWEWTKVKKARDKGYIVLSLQEVRSLMHFFSVPKVMRYKKVLDICMVYNGTSCGLNDILLWAPWFALPMGDQMLRMVEEGSWGADNNYGEMFLNFWLHDELQQYCGIDLMKHFPEELGGTTVKRLWEVWARPLMGIRPSLPGSTRRTGGQTTSTGGPAG